MANKRVRFHKQYLIEIKGKSKKWPFEQEIFAVQRFEDILVAFVESFITLHPGANVTILERDL